METDTVVNTAARLELLRVELASRGWESQLAGSKQKPRLEIANPAVVPTLNAAVMVHGDHYRWSWGLVVGPINDVSSAADRIMHVLRDIGSPLPADDVLPPSDHEAPHDTE